MDGNLSSDAARTLGKIGAPCRKGIRSGHGAGDEVVYQSNTRKAGNFQVVPQGLNRLQKAKTCSIKRYIRAA